MRPLGKGWIQVQHQSPSHPLLLSLLSPPAPAPSPAGRGVGWRGGGSSTKHSSNDSLWKPDREKYSRRVTVTERLLVTFSPTGINLNTHTKKQMFLKGQSGGKKHFQLSPLVPSYKSKSLSRVHKDTETLEREQG